MSACRPTDRGPPSAPTDQPDMPTDRPLMVYIPGLDGAGIGACVQFDDLGKHFDLVVGAATDLITITFGHTS